MCTDRHIYWKCLHKHSIEAPSTACEFYLVNLRFPTTSPSNSEISPVYREKYLLNKTKCGALHQVMQFVFEHHFCDVCELKTMVASSKSAVRDRQELKQENLARIAWKEDNIKRGNLRKPKRTFEEYLESLEQDEMPPVSGRSEERAGFSGVQREERS